MINHPFLVKVNKIDKKGGDVITLKSGKTKNCTPGKTFACGNACFAIGKNCKKSLDIEAKKEVKELTKTLKENDNSSNKLTKEKVLSKDNKNRFDTIDDPKKIKEELNKWDDFVKENLSSGGNDLDDVQYIESVLKDLREMRDDLANQPPKVQLQDNLYYLSEDEQNQVFEAIAKSKNIKPDIKQIKRFNEDIIQLKIGTIEEELTLKPDGTLRAGFSEKFESIEQASSFYTKKHIKRELEKGNIKQEVKRDSLLKKADKEIQDYENQLKALNKISKKLKNASLSDLEKISDSKSIIASVNSKVDSILKNADEKTKAKILTDKDGNPQSAMIYEEKEDSIYINFLASAPWNVAAILKDKRQTKGSGTNMILEAIKESEKAGKKGKVTLFPLDSAVAFYEKLGFEKTKKGSMGMTLSEEKAKLLSEKLSK